MRRINLLPYRIALRLEQRAAWQRHVLGAIVVGLGLAAMLYALQAHRLASQQQRNAQLQMTLQHTNTQLLTLQALEKDIQLLQQRHQFVLAAHTQRNAAVHVFNDLAQHWPDGAFIRKLHWSGHKLQIQGVAHSNERLAELLRNLSLHAQWMGQPQVQEISAGPLTQTPREARRVVHFNVELQGVQHLAAVADAAHLQGKEGI